MAMLSRLSLAPSDKVLDLGCGYGLVGIAAAKVTRPELVYLLDKDPTAIEFTKKNATTNNVPEVNVHLSDGFRDIQISGFDVILSNPPYHVDFSVPKHFIEKGFNRLVIGGCFYMVTKRLTWYREKLTSIFGGVQVWECDNGYYVFKSTKRSSQYSKK